MSGSRLCLGAAALLCAVSAASAAIPFNGSYSENFDSIGPTGTAAPADWLVGTLTGPLSRQPNGGGAVTARSLYVNDGTGGVANGTTATVGRSFNLGASGAADRAIGSAATTNDGTGLQGGDRVLQGAFTNSTGAPITSMTIGYTGEQWRFAQGASSSGSEGFFFFYSTAPDSGWVSIGLDFVAPHQTPGQSGLSIHTALDGNASANRIVLSKEFTLPQPLPAGSAFYLRWLDWNDNSTSDHVIAVDDISLGVVPEPASLSLLMVGGLLLGRRRSL